MVRSTGIIILVVKGNNKYILAQAALLIQRGGIVAFPTETVYGLGANAFDARAVAKIFEIKGRPMDNPVIVHIASVRDLLRVARVVPLMARKLARVFWPGPLTLVLLKHADIPLVTTGGLDTVAVRVPDHAVARALIRAAGVPIAAPSANTSGKPSPTTARHVRDDFGDRVPMILDGGSTRVGVESTVVDCTVDPPMILRQGGITRELLARVIPTIQVFRAGVSAAKSPGLRYRHYAPHAPLMIALSADDDHMFVEVQQFIDAHAGMRVGVLCASESAGRYARAAAIVTLGSRHNLRACARRLFAALREFDTLNLDFIIAERFPSTGIGAAVMDRLTRASQK